MIEDYFCDKGTIYSRTVDEWNRATDTATQVDCRIESSTRIIQDQDGRDIQTSHNVFLSDTATITEGDIFVIDELKGTATGNTRKYPVIRISRMGGFESSHIEVAI